MLLNIDCKLKWNNTSLCMAVTKGKLQVPHISEVGRPGFEMLGTLSQNLQ